MTPIVEKSWGRVAGGNGMLPLPGPSLPVERPVPASMGSIPMAAGLPVSPKDWGQPLPFEPERPVRGA